MAARSGGRTALVEDPADDVPVLRAVAHARREGSDRSLLAAQLAARLDRPMSLLGVLFLLVVLAQDLSDDRALQLGLATAGWLLWAVFVAEFLLRLYVAPSRGAFLRRNWWQVLFLAVPFLRFVRLVAVLRTARAGRVLSSAVRSSRSAGRLLGSRLGWLGVTSGIVVLASSQLLLAFGGYQRYAAALHDAALGTITGEPLAVRSTFGAVLELLLAAYSVVVFATLAGTLGAYFLEDRQRRQPG